MRSRAVLPVAGTVAAVVALAVTVAVVGPDGQHTPRPLRLAAGGVASGVTRDAAIAPGAGGSDYTLTGTLPAGRPDDAPAYTLPKGRADANVVTALAKALKAGTPVHEDGGWHAGGLFVSDDAGQSWWWSPCAPDTPVSSGERVACAVGGTAVPAPKPADVPTASDGSAPSSGSGSSGVATPVAPPPPASPLPEPSPMPKDEIRTAAAPVLAALGLDAADGRVDAWAYGGSVTVGRTIGGFEVYGMDTTVSVDQDGKVSGAGGFLGTPDKGDSYPLVTAREAYDELPPPMRALMCPVGPDGQGCAEPEPIEITGAHLGLMTHGLVDGGLALVPAWLFEVKGWTAPLPAVAVQKQYLPEPVASDDPGTKPEPPGSVEPAPPGSVEPAPPAGADPGTARAGFSFDKVRLGAKPDQLVVTYGDSSSCPHANVTAAAKEDSGAVYVVLEGDQQQTLVACTDDYRAVEVTVTLQGPLGDRKVYDASTGKVVPLS